MPDLTSSGPPGSPSRSISLQSLIDLLPDLVNNILNLYARAWTFTEDKLPQLAFSESTIRFTKLLALINLSGGVLDDDGLRQLVLNADRVHVRDLSRRLTTFPTKAELTVTLFRALPGPSTSSFVPIEDRTMILAAIASVLSELGYHRKKALVLKQLLSALIPALVQARKDDAAEMGFHPAASLASLNATVEAASSSHADTDDEIEYGVQSFLTLICHVYGISPFPAIRSGIQDSKERRSSKRAEYDLPAAIRARIVQQAALKSFGSQHLKLDVLRSCINICEALADLGGVLRFSAEMLRTAGSGVAPGPDSSGGSPTLSIEDQVRLASNISRTVSVARQLGKSNLEAEYWDDFLVRVIEHVDADVTKVPMPHAKADLEAVKVIDANEKKTPFIYNPFMKTASSNIPEALLVAQEDAVFRVTLQNLYDLDIEIERISLESRGLPFDSSSQSTLIGPYGTQIISIAGVPRNAGSLSITGCRVKVKGCRERNFPIFNKAWTPKADIKISGSAFGVNHVANMQPVSDESESSREKKPLDTQGPSTSFLAMNVIEAQPIVELRYISLPQSAIMLLEGETKMFKITLQNTTTVAVDMLFLSFTDSTTSQLRPSSTEKALSASETYELEYASLNKQSFRWCHASSDENIRIEPKLERTLEIEVLGKPGLSFGTIQVNYGHVGDVSNETSGQFYTRQLTIPLAITVNASIELVRNDLTPFTNDFAWQNKKRRQLSPPKTEAPSSSRCQSSISPNPRSTNRFQSLLARIGLNSQDESHCLLLLDLRNSWPSPLTISIQIRSSPTKLQSSAEPWERAYTVHEPIQPGHTSRVLLLVPRTYIVNSHAPIPSLAPDAKKRQFILSTAPKATPEAELAIREAFHYREALLSHVRATWEEESTHRTGSINLRALHLTTRMVSALRLDDLEIALSIHALSSHLLPSSSSPSSTQIHQVSPTKYIVPTSDFLTLRTTLTNRSSHPIHPILRLQPALKDQPHNIALDISKKFLWNGVLQHAVPTLGPGESRAVHMDFAVLCRGVFEIGAVAEEVRVLRGADSTAGLGGEPERRVWGVREGCVLVARDADTAGEASGGGEAL